MEIIGNYLLPGSLWFIMLSMGLSLTLADIYRVFRSRRALLVGVVSMLIIPPLVGTTLAILFAPTAALTVGFILLATCPGGMLSNLLTDYAKGDLALSLSLSIIVSLVYIVLVPFYAHFALNAFMGVDQEIDVPLLQFVWKIFSITLVPAALGVALRAWKNNLFLKIKGYVKNLGTLVLVCAFAVILADQISVLKVYFKDMVGITIALNTGTLALALLASRFFSLGAKEKIAIGVEHIIRQEGTAIYIAVSIVGNTEMSLPMILNTPVALMLGILFVYCARFFPATRKEPVL